MWRKGCWLLSCCRQFLHVDLVMSFVFPTRDIGLIIEQGHKDFYRVNCGSDHSLGVAKEDPVLCGNSISNTLSVLR